MTYDSKEHAEKLIATTAWLMSKRGFIQEVDVLRHSSADFDWYDSDGVIDYGSLHLEVSILLYEQIADYRNSLGTNILSVASELIGSHNILNAVIIEPKLEAPSNWRENLHTLSSSQFGMPKPSTKYKADVFMLMPFKDNNLDIVYRDHICRLMDRLGLTIKRGDDFFTKHSIVDDIWSAINAARIIIADCTGRNANVFYELGISHTLGKDTIVITQAAEDVPFDLQQWRYIKYVSSSQGLKQFESSLEDAISNLLKRDDDKADNSDIPSRVDDIPF